MKFLKIALASGLLATALNAQASDIRIDTSAFPGAAPDYSTFLNPVDLDTLTGWFEEFGFSGTLTTSIYDFNDASVAGSFIDTNIPDELTARGIPAAGITGLALDGATSVTLEHPMANDADSDIDALNPLVPPLTTDNEGYLFNWYLDTEFFLEGTLGATPSYTGGYIEFFIVDNINNTRNLALRAEVSSSSIVGVGLILNFDIVFALDDMFIASPDGGSSFFDIADKPPGTVPLRLDTNVDPPVPLASQLLVTAGVGAQAGNVFASRQTNLDGSIQIPVPEPSTIAIMGLGLLGAGFMGRRKKR